MGHNWPFARRSLSQDRLIIYIQDASIGSMLDCGRKAAVQMVSFAGTILGSHDRARYSAAQKQWTENSCQDGVEKYAAIHGKGVQGRM